MSQAIPTPPAPVAATPVNSFKAKIASFDVLGITKHFGGSSSYLVQALLGFLGGFAAGYLFKKYFRSFLTTAIACSLLILFLEQTEIITINWALFKEMVGIAATSDFSQAIRDVLLWVQENIILVVSTVGGCALGHHLGR